MRFESCRELFECAAAASRDAERISRELAAMARAWVDRKGEVHVACNLFTKSSFSFSDGGAAVEFRRKLDG